MSTASQELHQSARFICQQSLLDCSIEQAFAKKLTLQHPPARSLLFEGHAIADLTHVRRIRVLAAGKAAASMLHATLAFIAPRAIDNLRGVVIAPKAPDDLPATFECFEGGHPLPNQASLDGAHAALHMLQQAASDREDPRETLCIFLISGGGSAMMELPLDLTIPLHDIIALYDILLHCGASITEINCVRKHFSAIKGGRLGLAAGSLPGIALLVSDVPPGKLHALASGPTLPDASTVQDCRAVLAKYKILIQCPASIRAFFESPLLPETPRPGAVRIPSCVLLQTEDLTAAAADHAQRLGFHTIVDKTCDDWDYKAAANYLLARARSLRQSHDRLCLISAGEVTVAIPSEASPPTRGTGGRNQHLALYAATLLKQSDKSLVLLSAGSDGIDGNSTAAGAIVDVDLLHREDHAAKVAESMEALHRFDSSAFLAAHGATLHTGPTGNNLRDLRLLLTIPADGS